MSLLKSRLWRKICYFMILVLACFDLAVVAVVHPVLAINTALKFFSDASLKAYYAHIYCVIAQLFFFSSTALLTMILERYLALVYPFFHQSFVTKSRLLALLVLLQLPFGTSHFILLMKTPDGLMSLCLLALTGAVLLFLAFLNFRIFRLTKALQRRTTIQVGSLSGTPEQSCDNATMPLRSKVTFGKASTCLLTVICLTVCYFPFVLFLGLEGTGQLNKNDESYYIFYLWADTFLCINSSLNSLIFFFKNSALRRHGQLILAKCICTRSYGIRHK